LSKDKGERKEEEITIEVRDSKVWTGKAIVRPPGPAEKSHSGGINGSLA